jgi:glycerol-3-phosphate dehydrogenase (NAD(P)+)
VEYASILKNIYAIIIGIVDANFDSPNLRSLVLSKAINEMRQLIKTFGGQEETIFKYCGFGDFSLTALNDLSRNRTLGLLIGKGFFSQDISEKVVLEGRIAVQVFYEELEKQQLTGLNYPLMAELYKVFNSNYDIGKFVNNILND